MAEIVSRLDSRKLQFSKSEAYMETDFHDIVPQTSQQTLGQNATDEAAGLMLPKIEAALRMKQPEQLSAYVHALLNQYAGAPNLSHIYIRHVCTTLLQMLFSYLPPQSGEDLQNAAKEIYSFRHFSDIVKLIEYYLSKVTAEFREKQNAPHYAIYQVEQYIRAHFHEDLTLNLLADMVYLNPNYLSNLFAQVTGCTLSKYLKQVRMEKAQELLLNTNRKITDISQAVGFPSTSYFCKSFQKLFGTTPEKFRQGDRKSEKED